MNILINISIVGDVSSCYLVAGMLPGGRSFVPEVMGGVHRIIR